MHSFHSAAYKVFCARLRQARLERGLTQMAAGKALGIPHTRVSRMEQGERRVDVIELAAIAKLYRKSLSWFVPGA